jgi:hypothetical protein
MVRAIPNLRGLRQGVTQGSTPCLGMLAIHGLAHLKAQGEPQQVNIWRAHDNRCGTGSYTYLFRSERDLIYIGVIWVGFFTRAFCFKGH